MYQITLDGQICNLKKHYKYENICKHRNCRNKRQTHNLCMDHELDRLLDIGYGLNEYIIPQIFNMTAHEYFKQIRRNKFEFEKSKILAIQYNAQH